LHICGNIRRILSGIATLGCEMVDVDSMVPLDEARREIGQNVALAGNLDPVKMLRDGAPETITAALIECRRQAGTRYIVAAGCEVPRDTPEGNVRAMTVFSSAGQPSRLY
jgi:uroporphyrinogen-III decarboxylase